MSWCAGRGQHAASASALAALAGGMWLGCAAAASGAAAPVTVTVFHQVVVHFQPDSASKYLQPGTTAEDNGRIVTASTPTSSSPRRT